MTDDGSGFVLKIGNPADDPGVIDMQTQALLHVARTDPTLPVMRLVPTIDGRFHADVVGPDGRSHIVRMVTLLPGRTMASDELRLDTLYAFGVACARLGVAMRGFFHASAGHPLLWNVKHALELRPLVQHIPDAGRRAVVDEVLDRFEEHVSPVFGELRAQVIHNDLTPDNCLFDAEQRVSGVIDFGDMAHSALVCDFVSTVEPLMGERPDHFESLESTAAGYASITPFLDDEIAVLPDILLARWATTAVISAWRVRNYPENAEYITGWDAGVWAMLDAYRDLGSVEYERKIRDAMFAATRTGRPVPRASSSFDELVERRGRLLGSAISPLTYDRPLHLVRGRGAWLYDADGRAYLDCYNNVPVVGHSHPRVVEAIARQAATLNTNARYLTGAALELAERLIATMPDGLDTVMLVNSGSEANDLAWRLATTVTGGTGGLVTDFAYHGVTTVVADLSPEEWVNATAPTNVATDPGARRLPRRASARGAGLDDAVRGARGRRRRGARRAWRVARRPVRGLGVHERRHPHAARRLPAGRRAALARGRRAVRGRRGPVGVRAAGLAPLGVRRARRDPGCRHAGQAHGQRPPGGRGDHAEGHRGSVRARDRVVQHVRREPGGVRGGARGPRRDRTGARPRERAWSRARGSARGWRR